MSVLVDSYSESNQNAFTKLSISDAQIELGTSFTVITGGTLNSAVFNCKKGNLTTGSAYAKIYEITGTPGTDAKPTGSALAVSDAVNVAGLSTSVFALTPFTFTSTNKITLADSHNYFVVAVFNVTGSGTKGLIVGIDTNAGNVPQNPAYTSNGSTWSAFTNLDVCFYVYKDDLLVTKTLAALGVG